MSYYWLFAALTLLELILFILLGRFFIRLRQSESALIELQNSQAELLEKLSLNARLEDELLRSFKERQKELLLLDNQLRESSSQLRALLGQAEQVSRSPHFLREIIINGNRSGLSLIELAQQTGLSVDEIQLILSQAG
ncbi:MAG: hypothetical protein FWF99_02655 [Desulfovibrionaceae bacterium]|nr:hypothetical protein [Desulfovibrionaceae bacterium]